jgi:hypothetical protein
VEDCPTQLGLKEGAVFNHWAICQLIISVHTKRIRFWQLDIVENIRVR